MGISVSHWFENGLACFLLASPDQLSCATGQGLLRDTLGLSFLSPHIWNILGVLRGPGDELSLHVDEGTIVQRGCGLDVPGVAGLKKDLLGL